MRSWGSGCNIALGLLGGVAGSCACSSSDASCPIGALECPCTDGGGCNPGLACVENVCRGIPEASADGNAGTHGSGTSSAATSGPSDDSTGGGIKLDVQSGDSGVGPTSGCRAIDLLFVLDGSGSMSEERNALAATQAFTGVVETLEGLNGGGIDYRIAVTDDNDHGFIVPVGWTGERPWFDSDELEVQALATSFNGAIAQLSTYGGASLGCEHVLSSGVDLLRADATGFVRDDALLLLVLLTDVDDYGAYDQVGGHSCEVLGGCATPPTDLDAMVADLIAMKGDDPAGVSAIVIAGDPNVVGGNNFCDQPGSCCDGIDCQVFHATRLYAFTEALGAGGVFENLCTVGVDVPGALRRALSEDIDLACQDFEPPG